MQYCSIYYTHRPTGDSSLPPALSIVEPLGLAGWQALCATAQRCLNNNFCSFFMAMSGAVMALHFHNVMSLHDECPIILCYSPSCGTGEDCAFAYIII